MKKIRFILLILLTHWQFTSSAQDYFWSSKEEIFTTYEDLIDQDSSFTIDIVDHGNSVIVKIEGADSLEITHFFNQNGVANSESLCDSLIINLLCTDCQDKHVTKMLENKNRKWRQLPDQSYVSKVWVSKFWPGDKSAILYTVPMMKIIKGESSTVILIYSQEYTKKDWKEELRKKPIDVFQ